LWGTHKKLGETGGLVRKRKKGEGHPVKDCSQEKRKGGITQTRTCWKLHGERVRDLGCIERTGE